MVVKWSAYSPSTPTIRDQIPMKRTVLSVKIVFEKNENKQKGSGVVPKTLQYFMKPKYANHEVFAKVLWRWKIFCNEGKCVFVGFRCFDSANFFPSQRSSALGMPQWIQMHLPFCCPGFESYAHHLHFYQFKILI